MPRTKKTKPVFDELKDCQEMVSWYLEQVKWYQDGLNDAKIQLKEQKKRLTKVKRKSKAKPSQK